MEELVQESPPTTRRVGGRAARQALRSAPLADDVRPARAGLRGGWLKPPTDAGVARIADTLDNIHFFQCPMVCRGGDRENLNIRGATLVAAGVILATG